MFGTTDHIEAQLVYERRMAQAPQVRCHVGSEMVSPDAVEAIVEAAG